MPPEQVSVFPGQDQGHWTQHQRCCHRVMSSVIARRQQWRRATLAWWLRKEKSMQIVALSRMNEHINSTLWKWKATFDACKEHALLIAPVMVNVNSHAMSNCTRTMHNPSAQNKVINHQSQLLHNKNVSNYHAVIHVYLFILLLLILFLLLLIFLTVLSFSLVCWLSCVTNISASSISASASWSCIWNKNNSVSLQHFSPSANSAVWDFSLFSLLPLVSLDASINFFALLSQLPTSNFQQPRRQSTRFSLETPRRHFFILTFANK